MVEVHNTSKDDFSVGSKIVGRYLVDKILGEGGQGIVVKALDTRIYNNPVVIKALKLGISDKWSLDKFREEQRALAELQGATGIVNLIDNGTTTDGREFTVMEFVDGQSLTGLIDDLPNNLPRVSRLVQQIASAIEYAHRRQIYHRDLKPDNIMVANPHNRDELIKIIDFGIAKQVIPDSLIIELTTNIIGTPYYISPNALDGKPNPQLDDIYAFGMIAYQMVTGEYPVSTDNFSFARLRKMQSEITDFPPSEKNKSLSGAVDKVILRALSEDPAARYVSAEEFGDELCRALVRPVTGSTQLIAPVKKNRAGKIALFLVPLFLLALLGLQSFFRPDKTPENATNTRTQNSNQAGNVADGGNTNSKTPNNSSNSDIAQVNNNSPAPTPEKSSPPVTDSINPRDFSVKLTKRMGNNEPVAASETETFKTGDGIRINFTSEKNGSLRIFVRGGDGKSGQLSAAVTAGKTITYPNPQWIFFDDQPGTETIYVVFSPSGSSEQIDFRKLDSQSGGRTEYSTPKGSMVKIIRLNHEK